MRRIVMSMLTALVLTACGTYAPPPFTHTPSPTATATATASLTATPTPTHTATLTATPTATFTLTPEPSATPTATATETATLTPSAVPPVGDAAAGEVIFMQGKGEAPMCITCHQPPDAVYSVGPSLHGIGQRTADRLGEDAVYAYLHESIVEPSAYLTSGYRNLMYPQYGLHLSEQDIADVIAYLLTQ